MVKTSYSALVQSRYYHPALNSAIFDGQIRIYFSHVNESIALSIYFALQQDSSFELALAKRHLKESGQNYLLLLYPSEEAMHSAFDGECVSVAEGQIGSDRVLAMAPPFNDVRLSELLSQIRHRLHSLEREHALQS